MLGVSPFATEAEVKTAYKKLCKEWHPDAREARAGSRQSGSGPANAGMESDARFAQIAEAYAYLQATSKAAGAAVAGYDGSAVATPYGQPAQGGRIIGNPTNLRKQREERAAYEKWSAGSKARKQQAFEKRLGEFEEKLEEQKKYDDAMEAINAILVAEAIKGMIRGSHKAAEERRQWSTDGKKD